MRLFSADLPVSFLAHLICPYLEFSSIKLECCRRWLVRPWKALLIGLVQIAEWPRIPSLMVYSVRRESVAEYNRTRFDQTGILCRSIHLQ
ncbi:hypothetical protein HETIRDRAFT_481743 [Heterobasidion irregulare TC 32-1]|uniref:Uncharacterized protein n=1 Tax=Heterobasidion irregulare (strain TC 32-1) TaxID=747525 RepID=W4JTP9_HETIT|nr:uncharacterized protein HETIRDRAFT_481743 [Heterobasidion irregulare TC 32-1]ETW76261.1 hypothetical protein HETIRDRAFT_481743 [Heterobasidion irregulare TC 32-1]